MLLWQFQTQQRLLVDRTTVHVLVCNRNIFLTCVWGHIYSLPGLHVNLKKDLNVEDVKVAEIQFNSSKLYLF